MWQWYQTLFPYTEENHLTIIGGSATISPTTNGGSVITSTEATTTSTSGGSNGGGDLCADPNGFYPHPTDCQKYYQCAHGTPYEYTCASGLLWNDQLKYCDWETNVQCISGPTESTTTGPATSTSVNTGTTATGVNDFINHLVLSRILSLGPLAVKILTIHFTR